MTATAHALVAGAIARRFPDPSVAFILSLISHYILDCVPHWDFGTNWRTRSKSATGAAAIAETLVGISLAAFFFGDGSAPFTFVASVAASLLPDWLETPWYILFARANKKEPSPQAGWGEQLTYKIYKLQNSFHAKAQLPLGLITQIVTVGFFLFLLK